MARVTQTICDNEKCLAVKKSANRWWLVWVDDEGEMHLRPMRGEPNEGGQTFCGESCAQKRISEYMAAAKKKSEKGAEG